MDGSRAATLKDHEGAVFTIVFHPSGKQIATGGYEGKIRVYDPASGTLLKTFVPVPITNIQQASAALGITLTTPEAAYLALERRRTAMFGAVQRVFDIGVGHAGLPGYNGGRRR